MSAATLSPLDPAVIDKAAGDDEFYAQVHASLTGSERRAFETAVDRAYDALANTGDLDAYAYYRGQAEDGATR